MAMEGASTLFGRQRKWCE